MSGSAAGHSWRWRCSGCSSSRASSRTHSPKPADAAARDERRTGTIAADLHTLLAIASLVVVGFAAGEAIVRAKRRTPPGRAARRLEGLLLLAVGVTIAGGLGLFVGGARPREVLHVVYAVVAFGSLPIAVGLARQASPRRQGLASLAGAAVALVVVLRLFGTG